MVRPDGHDTIVELTEHAFWNDYLPIFDFYYQHLNEKIEADRISDDIYRLQKMRENCFVPLNEAFIRMKSESFKDLGEAKHNGKIRFPPLRRVFQYGARALTKISESF